MPTPAPRPSQIFPTGVALVTHVNETLRLSFRYDQNPVVVLPSLWRLAKLVVTEGGPLLVTHYRDVAP